MMADDHAAFLDLAAPYALGVLAGDERDAFVAHLATCAICRQEVASLARVVEALPQTLDQASLPPALRARVLAAATGPAAVAAPVPRRQPRSGASPWVGWLAAAATLAAVVFGAFAWISRTENASLREQLSRAQAREAELDRQIVALQSSAASAAQTTAVLRAADLGRVELAGQTGAPQASGRILWSASQGVVFVATNLPPLPPGRVYQLWVVADKPLSAGVVVPDAAGHLTVINSAPVTARPKAFAVTVEPEGGRPAPSGPPLLAGSAE
jgi:anti-sigma-K factor RskA